MRELVQRAREGDLEAFGLLVERFQDAVYGTAYALLGDFHDAQDVAQEAFIRAWCRLAELRDPDRFAGWLYRIARNCCVDFLRRAAGEPAPLEKVDTAAVAPAHVNPSAQLEAAEMREGVLAAIRSLSEPNRLATTLYYINGYSIEDVAGFLEVPVGTVKRRLHDSRNRLRERMVAMVEDELKGARPGPEFRERVMRKVSRVEVRPQAEAEWGRVLLIDEDGRCLLIIIGTAEEFAIHRGLEKEEPQRPMTHELLLSILGSFEISLKEARVVDLREQTFYGELVLERAGEVHVIDTRPSDALALAMMTGAKVTVAEHVMEQGCARDADGSPLGPEKAWDQMVTREKHMVTPEKHNERVAETCEALCDLPDESLKRLTAEVGLETLLCALMTLRERRTNAVGKPSPAAAGEEEQIEKAAKAAKAVRARLDKDEVAQAEAELRAKRGVWPGVALMKVAEELQKLQRPPDGEPG